MKKIVKITAAMAGLLFAFASCGTTSNVEGSEEETASTKESSSKKSDKKKAKVKSYDQASFDKAFAAKDYDTCLAYLELRNSDLILDDVDTYMLQYLDKDYQSSGRTINDTQSDMSQVSNGMTTAKTVEAALVGENSVEYYGPIYERLLTYSMKAINNLQAGSISGAKGVMDDYTGNYKSELAALNQKLKEVDSTDYSEKIKSANESLKNAGLKEFNLSTLNNNGAGYNPSSNLYEESAFLYYLGTLVYASNGNSESAKIMGNYYKNVKPLNSKVSKIDVSKDVDVPAGKGRIDVIALTDLIGKRSEGSIKQSMINVGSVNVGFKLVYPIFDEQNHKISATKVTLSTGDSSAFTVIEDFDDAVKTDVYSRQKGAYNRSIVRNVIKNSAAAVAGAASLSAAQASKDKAGSNAIARKAADAAYAKAENKITDSLNSIVESEKADVRQGTYFPNKASAAGFTVEPGTYTVTVEYSDGSKDVIDNVVVSAGKPTIVVSEKMN